MSIGPLGGVLGSAAGAPLSQTKGSEAERSAREGASQDSRLRADRQADAAAGVGTTEQDQGAEDRDADGRRLWEDAAEQAPPEPAADEPADHEEGSAPKRAKDPTGDSGTQLDLLG